MKRILITGAGSYIGLHVKDWRRGGILPVFLDVFKKCAIIAHITFCNRDVINL